MSRLATDVDTDNVAHGYIMMVVVVPVCVAVSDNGLLFDASGESQLLFSSITLHLSPP